MHEGYVVVWNDVLIFGKSLNFNHESRGSLKGVSKFKKAFIFYQNVNLQTPSSSSKDLSQTTRLEFKDDKTFIGLANPVYVQYLWKTESLLNLNFS